MKYIIFLLSFYALAQQEKDFNPEIIPNAENFEELNTLAEEDVYKVPELADPNKKANPDAMIEFDKAEDSEDTPPKVELIVDSSGSMGQILDQNKTKMYFSKKLLSRYLIDQWREKALVGMRVYGSRRKNDCEDNFLSVPFDDFSIPEIARQVSAMFPTGRTPIQESLQAAFKDLKSYKGPKRIVLFTDGKETCNGDPCKFAEKFKENPEIDVKIYVVAIGFDERSDDYRNVSCLGETLSVKNEQDLFDATAQISNKIKGDRNNLFVKSPKELSTVNVFRYDKDGNRRLFTTFTAKWGIRLPPGTYDAEVNITPIYKFPKFTIHPGKSVTLTVAGYGEVYVKFMDNLLNVHLLDKYKRIVHKFRSDNAFQAKTGKYTIHIFKDPFFSFEQDNFYVFPDGKHPMEVPAAGAITFNYPEIAGLYVYDTNSMLLGSHITNTPIVLKNGEYRLHVNDECFVKRFSVNNINNEILNVDCDTQRKLDQGVKE